MLERNRNGFRIHEDPRWFGADVAIMTMQYGTDVALLGNAIQRYVNDPGCRGELEIDRERERERERV